MTIPRRFTTAVLALLGAVVVYAYGDSRLTRASKAGLAVDADVIAVLPFTVRGPQPALHDLRDVIQDLIAARFPGGDGTPRALDPAAVLTALPRATRPPDDVVPLETSMHVAADLGAGHLLRGTVVGSPDDLTVEVELVAVPGGTVRARTTEKATADSLPYLTDRLVARLLAILAARDSEELAAMSATSLSALRAFLSGRAAARRGQMGTGSEATRHFERALFLDSTFALAGLRLAEIAAVFGTSELDDRWRLDAITRQRDRLGSTDQTLLDAYIGPRYPRPAPLIELIAAGERATLEAPNRMEAWRILGVHLLRFGSMIGYPGWEARSGEALRRAQALDSTDALTLEFLLQLAVGASDTAAVRRYAGLHLAHNPVGPRTDFIRWLAATMLVDSSALAQVRSRIPAMPPLSLRYLVEWSQVLGAGLEDADLAARVFGEGANSVGERRSVTVGIVPFLLNRGRPGAANRLLSRAERGFGQRADVGVLEFRVYAALLWDGDSSEAAAAAQTLAAYVDGAPAGLGQVRALETAACALAHWRLAANDLSGAEAYLARVRRLIATAGSDAIESTPVCVVAVDARLAAVQHGPNAAAALARLDALLAAGSDVRQLLPSVATVIAARLYEQQGDLTHALAITRRRTSWSNQLLSTQRRQEGRLAALVGDTAGAIRAYRHYLALRSDPEPWLKPEVERVRMELQRLEVASGAPAVRP